MRGEFSIPLSIGREGAYSEMFSAVAKEELLRGILHIHIGIREILGSGGHWIGKTGIINSVYRLFE